MHRRAGRRARSGACPLTSPARGESVHQDLRPPLVLVRRLRRLRALREPALGFIALPPFGLHGELGRLGGLHGCGLLPIEVLPPRRVRTAEDREAPVVQLGRLIHQIEEVQIVADDDERAGPGLDQLGEHRLAGSIEIVAGLVEEGDRQTAHSEARDRDEHHFAARKPAHAPVEVVGGETHSAELLVGPSLDVPVIADGVEVTFVDVPALDRPDRRDDRGDAQQVGDRGRVVPGQRLRQVADLTGHADRPGCREDLPADQPQERGLAGTVRPHETGAARGEAPRDDRDDRHAVRPGEREIRQHDGCVVGWHDLHDASAPPPDAPVRSTGRTRECAGARHQCPPQSIAPAQRHRLWRHGGRGSTPADGPARKGTSS